MAGLSPNEKLLWALIDNNDNDMEEALAAGADANTSSPTGFRPLHAAALRASASLINMLVQHKAEVDQADTAGSTPLMVAALKGRTDAVTALLANGANPNLTRLDTGETALHTAMDGGSPGVVKSLLAGGADINAQTTKEKFTPLHYAATFDARELAGILLGDPLCNAETKDKKRRTAAEVARDEKNYSLAKHLDMCTAVKNENDKQLVSAVMELDERAARTALEAGADANTSGPTGSCPLHAAALRGSNSLINILVQHKAEVDQADTAGFTPLMVAALNGRTDAVTALLASGANPKLTRRNSGETALHMAMDGGSPEVVRALVGGGADINAQTKNKFTPLHYALKFDAFDLADILKEYPHCSIDVGVKLLNKLRRHEQTHQGKSGESTATHLVKNMKVITQDSVPPSDNEYKVTSLPRGRVLILNYKNFPEKNMYREGAEMDTLNLETLFGKMGYDVTVRTDKKKAETRQELENFRNEGKLEDVHCVAVCVLSHGINSNTFITSDGVKMTVEEVYDHFTDDNCPMLKGKPKLFLFNFCRGQKGEACRAQDMLDNRSSKGKETAKLWPVNFHRGQRREAGRDPERTGAEKEDKDPTDNTTTGTTRSVVVRDRVSLYATVEGVMSLRSKKLGSYFIYSTVKIFAAYAHILHVEELAKKVNSFMRNDMGATTTDMNSNTTKKFYLNPVTRE